MKTLPTIQKLSKLGKVLSRIAFIFAVIGFVGCIAGLISAAFGNGSIIKLGSVSLHGMISASGEANLKGVAAALTGWLILCAGEAVLAKFAEAYFVHELKAGTPFTLAGAKELLRLGVLAIALPAVSHLAANIAQEITAGIMGVTLHPAMLQLGLEESITLGVMMIVMSLLCRHGAELAEGK